MRHVVLLNVSGSGYTTYAGTPHDGFVEQPLEIETTLVSRSVLGASRALNDMVRGRRSRVSVSLRHEVESRPVVAYGSFFPSAVDEKGRAGLVFIHAIEVDAIEAIVPATMAVLGALSEVEIELLGAEVAAVARDRSGAERLLERVSDAVQRRMPSVVSDPVAAGEGYDDLVAIEHDCYGAGPVAWLLFAHTMSTRAPGWVVEDRDEEDRVVTCVRDAYAKGAQVLRASQIMGRGVGEYLSHELEETLRTARHAGGTRSYGANVITDQATTVSSTASRSNMTPAVDTRRSMWIAWATGLVLGALVVGVWAVRVRNASGAPEQRCDGGTEASMVLAVCDASVTTCLPCNGTVVEHDADMTNDEDAAVSDSESRQRRRDPGGVHTPSSNGVRFPVLDRPRPRVQGMR